MSLLQVCFPQPGSINTFNPFFDISILSICSFEWLAVMINVVLSSALCFRFIHLFSFQCFSYTSQAFIKGIHLSQHLNHPVCTICSLKELVLLETGFNRFPS